MRSQAFHLLFRLDSGIFKENLVVGIHRSCIHEILPNQDAQRVADVEEIIRRINAAAPNAQHVEMRIFGLTKQLQRVVGIDPGLNHLLGDIVGAFGIEWHAVHLEIERPPDAVRLIHHLEGADARAERP